MAKTVVSAVKPGRQAFLALSVGLSCWCVPVLSLVSKLCAHHGAGGSASCARSWRSRVVCSARRYLQCLRLLRCFAPGSTARSAAHTFCPIRADAPLAIGHWRLYIDNGRCRWWRVATDKARSERSPAPSLVSDHISGPGVVPARARTQNPVKIAPLSPRLACSAVAVAGPFGSAPGDTLVIHWIHVSIFFPQQNVRRT